MKRRRAHPVPPEDAALFREAVGTVRRIDAEAAATDRPAPAPEPRRLHLDEAEALRASRDVDALAPIDAADVLEFRRDHVPERTLRQLRRGQFSIQDELDLHHLRAADAERLLKTFLNQARHGSRLCVRIVHGKGLRSESTPVLKSLVDRVLRHRGDVLAFASAPLNQGGTGAVLVLLAPNG
jgi:DNA-nicking Smr family endonuclease